MLLRHFTTKYTDEYGEEVFKTVLHDDYGVASINFVKAYPEDRNFIEVRYKSGFINSFNFIRKPIILSQSSRMCFAKWQKFIIGWRLK